jgi:hypothetical protein
MARDPELYSVNRAAPYDEDPDTKAVEVRIIYRGLKGEPIDTVRMTTDEAVQLAAKLLSVVAMARGWRP